MRTWSLIRLFTLLVYLFMFTPIAIVVILSFNDAQFGGFPSKASLRWFYALAENDHCTRLPNLCFSVCWQPSSRLLWYPRVRP